MNLDVAPPVGEEVERALREALAEIRAASRQDEPAWTQTARVEAVEREETYAFSPRSTRGATRA